jgi:thiol-disulfide isomerase/thioredoxin
MKILSYKLFFVIILFVFAAVLSVSAQNNLKVGDKAPELKSSKWIKGTPIEKFEKGKIYVIEFWATWCGPCKINIPHLTEMAHKYKGQVTIIGMDGSEKASSQGEKEKIVSEFVSQMGDKMDYNVVLDSEDHYMVTNWMQAAGQNGIPCAFIVNKDNIVNWIGYPMYMEKVLDRLLKGEYSLETAIGEFNDEQNKKMLEKKEQERFTEEAKEMLKANKNKDYARVITECEAIVTKEPAFQNRLDRYYLNALAKADPEKLLRIVKEEQNKNNLERIENIISVCCEIGTDKKVSQYAISVLAPRIDKTPNDSRSLKMISTAYENIGDKENAIKAIEKLIEIFKSRGDNLVDEYIKRMEKKIAELKNTK